MNRLVLVPLSRGQGNCTDTTFIPSEMRVVVHVDWGDNEFLRKDLGYWINLEDDNVIPQNKGEKL